MNRKLILGLVAGFIIMASVIILEYRDSEYPELVHGELVGNQFETDTVVWWRDHETKIETDVSNSTWYRNEDIEIMFIGLPGYDAANISTDVDYTRAIYPDGKKRLIIEISDKEILIKDPLSTKDIVDIRQEHPELNPINQEVHSYRDTYNIKWFDNPYTDSWMFLIDKNNLSDMGMIGLETPTHFISVVSNSLDDITFSVFVQSLRTL